MKKLLIYYNFIVVSLFVLVGFVSAQNTIGLVSAVLFYPMFVYFAQKIIPGRRKAIILPSEHTPIMHKYPKEEDYIFEKTSKTADKIGKKGKIKKDEVEKLEQVGSEVVGNKKKFDIDRRAFLKLIGSGGAAMFIFSVFGIKKAQAAFFGSVPGPGIVGVKDSSGTRIDPAIKHPTDGYRLAELDDDSATAYYGFVDKDGNWFVIREESTGTYKYWKGTSDFETNWALRDDGGTTYDYYDNVF